MMVLRIASFEDIPSLQSISNNPDGYFERCFDEGRLIAIAADGNVNCGYGMLNFAPRYALYKKMNYPEIQDVYVRSEHRGRGIATRIIEYLERVARDKNCNGVGISVGITREFGSAQRLYIKLGYMPDGFGATYDRDPVAAHTAYIVDELCLMLVKSFT